MLADTPRELLLDALPTYGEVEYKHKQGRPLTQLEDFVLLYGIKDEFQRDHLLDAILEYNYQCSNIDEEW